MHLNVEMGMCVTLLQVQIACNKFHLNMINEAQV